MRVSDRMRWWCTAESMSSDGIGARSLFESRSLSTMKDAPSSIASSTSSHIAVEAIAHRLGPVVDPVEAA